MVIIEGVKYYTKNEVAQLVERSAQTVNLWDKWSNEKEEKGEERLIPKPIRWKSNYRLWSEADVEKIREFAGSIQWGQLSEYSRRQWGKKGEQNGVLK